MDFPIKGMIRKKQNTKIKVENNSGEARTLDIDGMFVAIGLVPQNEPFSQHISLNNWGYAEAGEDCKTN